MDLNDVWQSHKRFILGVGAALVVVLIAKVAIRSTWDVESVVRAARAANSNIGRTEVPDAADLSRIEGESAGYEERMQQLYGRLAYQVVEKYRLPQGGSASPDLMYNDIREKATEELVDVARRYNIYVDPSLGLPPLTPPGREAIQRTLYGLAMVERVVLTAILAQDQQGLPLQVSAFDKIEILKPRVSRKKEAAFVDELAVRFEITGSTAALALLIDQLVRQTDPYLAVDDFEIDRDEDRTFGLTRMKITLAGLSITPEATVTGGRS